MKTAIMEILKRYKLKDIVITERNNKDNSYTCLLSAGISMMQEPEITCREVLHIVCEIEDIAKEDCALYGYEPATETALTPSVLFMRIDVERLAK